MTDFIAGIAVENTTRSFDKIFDYRVDSALADEVCVGKRVLVPFGSGNRKRQGVVFYTKQGEAEKLKSVISVLDKTPVLTDEMLKLASFMKEHYEQQRVMESGSLCIYRAKDRKGGER